MFVARVLELVELTPLRNVIVGLPGVKGLSTEQRKRCTIAMDERTSGLDSHVAMIVMSIVSNTVNTGRTVDCTIH